MRSRYNIKLRLVLLLLVLAAIFSLNVLKDIELDLGKTCESGVNTFDVPADNPPELTGFWLKEALNQGLPPSAAENRESLSSRGLADQWLSTAAEIRDPRGVIAWELSWLPAVESGEPTPAVPVSSSSLEGTLSNGPPEEEYYIEDEAEITGEEPTPFISPADGLPLVGIYNTHNAEAYTPTYGKDKVEGENGGVFKVAQRLREVLQGKYRVPVVQSDTIHDYPDFNKSYTNSAQTARNMVKTYPSLKMVLDIHRDSLPSNSPETIEIDGKKTAKILIIVGTNQRSDHPNWRTNLELAENVAKNLEASHPGICRGIRMKAGTYNQQYHPGSLLIEVGNANNSLEEAERAVEYLAEALSRCLQL